MSRFAIVMLAVVFNSVAPSLGGQVSNQSMLRGTVNSVISSQNASVAQAQTEDVLVGASLSGNIFVGAIWSAYHDYQPKCLNHNEGNPFNTNNHRANVEECSKDSPSQKAQKFQHSEDHIKTYFGANMCLENYNGWNSFLRGEAFFQNCQPGKRSQMWQKKYHSFEGGNSRYEIRSMEDTMKCLELNTQTFWVRVRECLQGRNQLWIFDDSSD